MSKTKKTYFGKNEVVVNEQLLFIEGYIYKNLGYIDDNLLVPTMTTTNIGRLPVYNSANYTSSINVGYVSSVIEDYFHFKVIDNKRAYWIFQADVTHVGTLDVFDASGSRTTSSIFTSNIDVNPAYLYELSDKVICAYGISGDLYMSELDKLGNVIQTDISITSSYSGMTGLFQFSDDTMGCFNDTKQKFILFDDTGSVTNEVDYPGHSTEYSFEITRRDELVIASEGNIYLYANGGELISSGSGIYNSSAKLYNYDKIFTIPNTEKIGYYLRELNNGNFILLYYTVSGDVSSLYYSLIGRNNNEFSSIKYGEYLNEQIDDKLFNAFNIISTDIGNGQFLFIISKYPSDVKYLHFDADGIFIGKDTISSDSGDFIYAYPIAKDDKAIFLHSKWRLSAWK